MNLKQQHSLCHAREVSGKRVFLGGLYFRENEARKAFVASVLNKCELLTMHILKKKKSNAGLATW